MSESFRFGSLLPFSILFRIPLICLVARASSASWNSLAVASHIRSTHWSRRGSLKQSTVLQYISPQIQSYVVAGSLGFGRGFGLIRIASTSSRSLEFVFLHRVIRFDM